MDHPPFTAGRELYKGLEVVNYGEASIIRRAIKPEQQGGTSIPLKDSLPGEPRVQLNDAASVSEHLKEELATEQLNRLAPYLWLVGKQDSSHISSLTHQIVRGREIIITEKPELHLVWYYNRVFIKPLPKYLLSHAFWDFYLASPQSPIPEPMRSELKAAALGFLRSYSYLVRRRSDFDMAMDENRRLLPKKTKYSSFVQLTKSLEAVDGSMVSPRYHYGELRLSRLNFWVKVFLFRFAYHRTEGQYGAAFARFYGPILFLFGIFSVILSAMQVILAVLPLTGNPGASWLDFARISRGFSVLTLFVIAIVILFLSAGFIGLSSREIIYASRDLYHMKRTKWRANRSGGSEGPYQMY